MKPYILFGVIVAGIILHSGCTSHDIYIIDSDAKVPVPQRPLHTISNEKAGDISITGGVHVFPQSSLAGRTDEYPSVGPGGQIVLDTTAGSDPPELLAHFAKNTHEFQGRNMHWDVASVSGHAALSVNISGSNYFRAGGQYGRIDGMDYWGGFAALGFFKESPGVGMAFEFGYALSRSRYSVSTADYATGYNDDYSKVTFQQGHGYASSVNYFFNVTLNTNHETWPVNLIFRFAGDRQGTFEHGYHTNPDVSNVNHTAMLWSFTPAAILNIGGGWNLNAGVQLIYDGSILEGDNFIGPVPLVELEWKIR